MKPGTKLFRIVAILAGIGFALLSLFGIFLPSTYIGLLEVSKSSPSLNSHFRYLNVLFLSYAFMLFLLYKDSMKYRLFLLILGLGMFGGGIARILGIVVDGLPNIIMLIALVGELLLGVVFYLSYRRAMSE